MHIHSIVGFCVQIIHNPIAEITAKTVVQRNGIFPLLFFSYQTQHHHIAHSPQQDTQKRIVPPFVCPACHQNANETWYSSCHRSRHRPLQTVHYEHRHDGRRKHLPKLYQHLRHLSFSIKYDKWKCPQCKCYNCLHRNSYQYIFRIHDIFLLSPHIPHHQHC